MEMEDQVLEVLSEGNDGSEEVNACCKGASSIK